MSMEHYTYDDDNNSPAILSVVLDVKILEMRLLDSRL